MKSVNNIKHKLYIYTFTFYKQIKRKNLNNVDSAVYRNVLQLCLELEESRLTNLRDFQIPREFQHYKIFLVRHSLTRGI